MVAEFIRPPFRVGCRFLAGIERSVSAACAGGGGRCERGEWSVVGATGVLRGLGRASGMTFWGVRAVLRPHTGIGRSWGNSWPRKALAGSGDFALDESYPPSIPPPTRSRNVAHERFPRPSWPLRERRRSRQGGRQAPGRAADAGPSPCSADRGIYRPADPHGGLRLPACAAAARRVDALRG